MKRRLVYLLSSFITILIGLASRKYRNELPSFVGEYSGDTLWGLMLFLIISFLLAERSVMQRGLISAALAVAVEFSQLYHAPWIEGIRSSTLGCLVLGFQFVWTDLVCYSIGIASGILVEHALLSKNHQQIDA